MRASVELCRAGETDLLNEPDRVLVRRDIHHRAMAWSGEERKSDKQNRSASADLGYGRVKVEERNVPPTMKMASNPSASRSASLAVWVTACWASSSTRNRAQAASFAY